MRKDPETLPDCRRWLRVFARHRPQPTCYGSAGAKAHLTGLCDAPTPFRSASTQVTFLNTNSIGQRQRTVRPGTGPGYFLQKTGWILMALSLLAPTALASDQPLFPEASDPVLGHRAAIVEWAWSPKYAERFDLPVQEDGLPNGDLWLVGVKVVRQQVGERPRYSCRIVGLLSDKTPINWPPGDQHLQHPSHIWIAGILPGLEHPRFRTGLGITDFTPYQAAWHLNPANDRERQLPESNISVFYRYLYKNYVDDLAYFEIEGACWYFRDPEEFQNRVHLPSAASQGHALRPGALSFDIPNRVMNRIYPVVLGAADRSKCLMRRSGIKKSNLFPWERKRLGDVSCEPAPTE